MLELKKVQKYYDLPDIVSVYESSKQKPLPGPLTLFGSSRPSCRDIWNHEPPPLSPTPSKLAGIVFWVIVLSDELTPNKWQNIIWTKWRYSLLIEMRVTRLMNLSFCIVGQDLGGSRFPFAMNISSSPPGTQNQESCRGRCQEISPERPLSECMCDRTCMYLGDCCYDYLMECDPRDMDLPTALHQQYQTFRRFRRYSKCVNTFLEEIGASRIRMVTSCPSSLNDNISDSIPCGARDERTISTYVPVESNGVLYSNMYCAACHGQRFHQLRPVAYHGFACKTMGHVESQWLPFDKKLMCIEYKLRILPGFDNLKRYMSSCGCFQPDRTCTDEAYEEECNAYAYIVYDRDNDPYNNQACKECDDDGNAETRNIIECDPSNGVYDRFNQGSGVLTLFDFTGISMAPEREVCVDFYNKGQSGNPCLVMHCQDGFEVHENRCMSVATTKACYPPHQNRHKQDYQVANLFQSAMVLHYRHTVPKDLVVNTERLEIIEQGAPCSKLPHIYNSVLPQGLPDSVKCAIVFFDSMTFANLSGELQLGDIALGRFPDIEVFHTLLLNHDPVSGISCAGGTSLKRMTQFQVAQGGQVKIRSRKTRHLFQSNRDPLVMSRKKGESRMEMWSFVCRLHMESTNCSAKLKEDAMSPIDICLKYVLTDNNSMEKNTILLNSGKRLESGEYMRSATGDILVCVDLYDKLHQAPPNKLLIVVCVGYSVSLACLLVTFLIHIRYRELRTLPGLMLMNLIIALFFAQLLFLLNTFDLFQVEPILCQIMASAQHYFWLASFAWMACMSLDIFLCLSSSCTTVNTYTASKYLKYVLAGWLVPLLIPLITNILTNAPNSSLGYNTFGSCWLSNSQGVLYLFAIPVFTIVCANIVLFIGSVCRLCSLLKNASFVGRKEDNKQRLAQCIKLSSWMGFSWIFGIVPNFVGVEALWFVFVTANALQGVHIFVAFGITGKARNLMNTELRGAKDTHVGVSAIPTVVAELTMDKSYTSSSSGITRY